VAVNIGTHRSEFTYDGLQRRARMTEKDNDVTMADTRLLWGETAIWAERAADGVTVTRRSRNLSGPSAANWQICYRENPDCAKYMKYCIKTAVTPMGGTPATTRS
jgi:hypothetical protein